MKQHIYSPGSHHHHGDPREVDDADANLGWLHDNFELLTVGIDIGSSTSHMIFSQLHLQRVMQGLSSSFVVTERRTLWKSDVILTPYAGVDEIDTEALDVFVRRCYDAASIAPADVDTGVVILTGLALERANSLAIATLFADSSGRFVCALAGHHREAVMAAMGSGAAKHSAHSGAHVVNIDVGGGTTKLASLVDGEVQSTAALEIGARMLVMDDERHVVVLTPAGRRVALEAGLDLAVGSRLDEDAEERLAGVASEIIHRAVTLATPHSATDVLWLTDPIAHTSAPDVVTFSGGVSEYIHGRETATFGDLGPALGSALTRCFESGRAGPSIHTLELGIRATAVGLSQFAVQASGSTVNVSEPDMLPLRNVPVVLTPITVEDGSTADEVAAAVRSALAADDLDPAEAVAIQLRWNAPPSYALLRGVAEGIARELGISREPLVIAMSIDLAASLGHMLATEVPLARPYACIDGVDAETCDYMDIGEMIQPAMVLPVIVKSMLFDSFERHAETAQPTKEPTP